MNDVLLRLWGFVLRLGLLLAGLVFFACLLSFGLLLLLLWLLRALWAKLTGQPVRPWTFQMHRQQTWQRFYRRGFADPQQRSKAEDVVDARVIDVSNAADVEVKRMTPPS